MHFHGLITLNVMFLKTTKVFKYAPISVIYVLMKYSIERKFTHILLKIKQMKMYLRELIKSSLIFFAAKYKERERLATKTMNNHAGKINSHYFLIPKYFVAYYVFTPS